MNDTENQKSPAIIKPLSLKVLTAIRDDPGCATGSAWALLVAMAFKADDDGGGIWQSLGNLARQAGISKTTVKSALDTLLKSEIVVDTGKKTGQKGHQTCIYLIDLIKLGVNKYVANAEHLCRKCRADAGNMHQNGAVSQGTQVGFRPGADLDPGCKPDLDPVPGAESGYKALALKALKEEQKLSALKEPTNFLSEKEKLKAPNALKAPDAPGAPHLSAATRLARNWWVIQGKQYRQVSLIPSWEAKFTSALLSYPFLEKLLYFLWNHNEWYGTAGKNPKKRLAFKSDNQDSLDHFLSKISNPASKSALTINAQYGKYSKLHKIPDFPDISFPLLTKPAPSPVRPSAPPPASPKVTQAAKAELKSPPTAAAPPEPKPNVIFDDGDDYVEVDGVMRLREYAEEVAKQAKGTLYDTQNFAGTI